MSKYSPRPTRESMGKDYVCNLSPGCSNCRELFDIFSETEAKRFNAVEIHIPFWKDLVKEALTMVPEETFKLYLTPAYRDWAERAQKALNANS